MSPVLKASLIRFGRAVAAAAAAGAITGATNALTGGVFDGTAIAIFVPVIGAALLAVDKYVRAKLGHVDAV